jgi:hypothetical protein
LNILLLVLEVISRIKKSDLENSKFLYPIRFQYEEFNKSDKSKF